MTTAGHRWFRATAFLGLILLTFASIIMLLIPEESIRAWPLWAKIVGGAFVATGVALESAWAIGELKKIVASNERETKMNSPRPK